jgi:NAD(P)-dependent dehydrogenase (short-subunit alcohol dehydrogenase family)
MPTEYWRDKKVLITGGSAGFGWAMADRFANAGAQVGIVARDAERLNAATTQLRERHGRDVLSLLADVTQQADVDAMFEKVGEEWGGLDVVVNNVGKSDRGRLLDVSAEKLRDLWATNVLSAFLCTQHALPMLRQSKGHIVTIGSLASKSAAKYLGAYAMSKFPLSAFAQQLRYELADDGIHVLLVCPGPMQRDDAGDRYNDLADDLPEEARRPGAGVKLKRLDPLLLADRVLVATEKRELELVLPGKSRLLFAISQLSPRLGDWILKRKQ